MRPFHAEVLDAALGARGQLLNAAHAETPLPMITQEFAARFAADWIAAWNAHDLDRILGHYTEDFEMASPVIAELMGEPSGRLKGKGTVRSYWAKALARHPALHFELLHALAGAASITIVYRGHRGLSAEVFWLDANGKVERAAAHYGAL